MSTLTVTAKGQVTLRKDLATHPGVRPGDRVAVDKLPAGRITDVFGFLKRADGPRLSIEEINQVAAEAWAGER